MYKSWLYEEENKKLIKEWICPSCHNKLVYRKNKRNGNKFLGCSNFPECKFSVDYSEYIKIIES